ncbi:hypothetical protein K7I13_13145 [Brucepastera parasyntrophica]|uniref:hypothetical protein n=1 Tax=Brucepastera parasyntrophica TaxID=2880008 RepID=UPI002109EF6D|nr:hypothetical protein [Brucepastera parasyntrophica]ULQ59409.1 hypothetical protein K7I13_13145 [Brucepastera parasyntrophica]
MKIRTLFIILNIVLLLTLFSVFFLPVLILGENLLFNQRLGILFVISGTVFILVLLLLNILFFANWKILAALENEDWPALAGLLETDIFEKKKLLKWKIRLLCIALVLLTDFETIEKLILFLQRNKPSLYRYFSPQFASLTILSGSPARAYEIATGVLVSGYGKKNSQAADWLRFYAAFARHLGKYYAEAADRFVELALNPRHHFVTAMSGYLCGVILQIYLPHRREELQKAAVCAREYVIKSYSHDHWNRTVLKFRKDVQAVLLSRLLSETGDWLYPDEKPC